MRDPEKVKLAKKRYAEKNREKINERRRLSRILPEVKAKEKAYRESIKEKQKEYFKNYYQENKEELIVKNNQYRLEHLEECREYRKEYYQNNKDYIKEYQKKNEYQIKKKRKERKEWLQNIKSNLICFNCNENHPACLDFHHINPKEKIDSVSNLICYAGKKDVLEEIKKCNIYCANCHKIIHYEQRCKQVKYVKKIRKWFEEIKSCFKCIKCGIGHIAFLEFHHRDPKDKKDTVCSLLNKNCSKEIILEEIFKCDPMCANCHRKFHYNEKIARRLDK